MAQPIIFVGYFPFTIRAVNEEQRDDPPDCQDSVLLTLEGLLYLNQYKSDWFPPGDSLVIRVRPRSSASPAGGDYRYEKVWRSTYDAISREKRL